MNEEDRKKPRQQIWGMLFQGSALFDSMTVEQNITFPLDMFTNDSFTKKLSRVNEVLDRVNLKEVNNKFPAGEISGGMKKRVGIAWCNCFESQAFFSVMNRIRDLTRRHPY